MSRFCSLKELEEYYQLSKLELQLEKKERIRLENERMKLFIKKLFEKMFAEKAKER